MKSVIKIKRAGHPLNQFLLQQIQSKRKRAIIQGRQNQAFAFKKVVNSLQKYPIPLICQQQCAHLQGVGNKISSILSSLIYKQYKQYRIDSEKQQINETQDALTQISQLSSAKSQSFFKSKPKNVRKYSPQPGSGAWNILNVLSKASKQGNKSLKKPKIKQQLKKQTGKSSVQSMKSLIKHGYLQQQQQGISITMLGKTFLLQDKQIKESKVKKQPKKQHQFLQLPKADKVILIIDNRQVRFQKDRDYFIKRLHQDFGIQARLQNLSVGDFLWIAVCKQQEWVVGHVVQRKSIDDLASSIIDGRYRQQKHRLLSTNLSCYYLIQGQLQQSRLSNAAISTGLAGFTVIRSEGMNQSCQIIAQLTKSIQQSVLQQNWYSICTFSQYQKNNSKQNLNLNQQLALMLRQIDGVGKDAALTLTSHFLTWRDLYDSLYNLDPQQKYALISDTSKKKKRMNFSAIERLVRIVSG